MKRECFTNSRLKIFSVEVDFFQSSSSFYICISAMSLTLIISLYNDHHDGSPHNGCSYVTQ